MKSLDKITLTEIILLSRCEMRTTDLIKSINTDTNDKQGNIIGQNWFPQHLSNSAKKIMQASKIDNNKHVTSLYDQY